MISLGEWWSVCLSMLMQSICIYIPVQQNCRLSRGGHWARQPAGSWLIVGQQQNKEMLGKCLNLYRWECHQNCILIWHTAHKSHIDKFSSVGSGSYYLKWKFDLCNIWACLHTGPDYWFKQSVTHYKRQRWNWSVNPHLISKSWDTVSFILYVGPGSTVLRSDNDRVCSPFVCFHICLRSARTWDLR